MKLINDNNLSVLSDIPDNSIDLILTDPPYNISMDNNLDTIGRSGIDFGEWDKDADILSWIDTLPNILTKNGSIVIFNAWRNLDAIAKRLESNGMVVKDLIRWEKTNPMPRNRDRRYIVDYEFAIWAVNKNAKWTFNRQSETYDRSEIQVALTPRSEKVGKGHPTQKPIALMQDLLLRHSNPGDTVLDPFMGSGTTGVTCVKNDRNFIGVELDKSYFDVAQKRISEIKES